MFRNSDGLDDLSWPLLLAMNLHFRTTGLMFTVKRGCNWDVGAPTGTTAIGTILLVLIIILAAPLLALQGEHAAVSS
jgi:hypothetical protein